MRKSILNQTEIAMQAYIRSVQGVSALAPVNVYAAQQLTLIQPPQPGQPVTFANITPPNLIFRASSPTQFVPDVLIYELRLEATLETQVDDEMDVAGQDIHHARVEALRDALENFETVYLAVNKPTGADTRVVKNFTLSSIVFEEEDQANEDRRFTTTLNYYVLAAPADG